MNDKTLRTLLFGNYDKLQKPTGRSQQFYFPAATEDERSYSIKFRTHDGLVHYLVKKIDALTSDVQLLQRELKVLQEKKK